jgi:DNA-directed RNA polymerase specialized sigma24 family protein
MTLSDGAPVDPSPEPLQRHAAFVRRLARELVGDAHGGEDVEQEAWLAALEHPPRHGANPRAWLAVVVRRLAARGRRAAGRRARREEAAARPERVEGPDEVAARRETLRRVTDAVLALEEPYQTALFPRSISASGPFNPATT